MRSKLITFEGIDGSGKTTIAERVFQLLRKRGVDSVLTFEPTKTWLGDAVKRGYSEDLNPISIALLFLADRAHHVEEIKRWLSSGKVILCDRYCDSTYAYQGAALDGIVPNSLEWLKRIGSAFTIKPDLTILLLVDPEVGLARISDRERKTRFEEVEFLTKVQEHYLKLAEDKRFVKLDASLPIEVVAKEALRAIEARFPI